MKNRLFAVRCFGWLGVLPLALVACGGNATGVITDSDGGDGSMPTTDGGGGKDTGAKDAGTKDTGVKDTGAKDTGTKDTGAKDSTSGSDTGTDTGTGSDTGADTGTGSDTGADTGGGSDTGTDTGTGVDAGVDAGHDAGNTGGAVCGNGVIEGSEQCDDGNLYDLDGCDSKCNYEVVTRMTSIAISGNAGPAFCVHNGNALGHKAIAGIALGQLNTPLQTDVTNGTVNVLTQFLALSDTTGTNATGFSIGVLDAELDPAKGTWPAAGNPIDWWFLADPTTVAAGVPTGLLTTGVIANHALTAGPSTVDLVLNLAGTPADLTMRDAKIVGTIGTPTDVPAPPPAALAAGMTVFETITANGANQGLCGDITVQSLAQIPIPQTLAQGGGTACGANYTYCGAGNPVGASCNSLLDVLIGGCTVDGIVTAINKTQPDVPPTGSATVTTLTASGATKKVTVPMAAETEAYSAYLTFAANRAHFTGEYCTGTAQCQTGLTCTAGVCK